MEIGRRVAAYLRAEGSPDFIRFAEGLEIYLITAVSRGECKPLEQCVGWKPKQGEAPWWREALLRNRNACILEYADRFVKATTETEKARQISEDIKRHMATRRNGSTMNQRHQLLEKIVACGLNVPTSARQIMRILEDQATYS